MSEAPSSGLRLAILAGAALLLALAIGLPIAQAFAQQGDDVETERTLLAKYRADIAARSELQAQLDMLRQQEGSATTLLHGDSTSLAAASMQGLLKALVERHGGQLRSAQMLSATGANGLEKVVLQYEVSIPLGGLKAVTYELETGSPFLFVDDVDIRPDTFAGGEAAAPTNLHVQWTVHGYRRLEAP
jgi:general secretion pathway protein M